MFCFVLFVWTPSRRKEVGIPLGILPHVWEQNKHSYFPWPGNPIIAAAGDQTQRLARHQAATRTQADWNSVCPQRNPGVRTAPGRSTAAAMLGLTRPRKVGTFVLFPDVRQNPLWDTHFLPSGRRPFKQNKTRSQKYTTLDNYIL